MSTQQITEAPKRCVRGLKVLHVGPGRGQKGGIASVLSELAIQRPLFSAVQIELSFFETRGFRSIKDLVAFFALDVPRFIVALMNGIDLVHFHVSVGGSFYRKFVLYVLASIARKKSIFHLHSGDFERFRTVSGPLTRLALWLFVGRASAAISVGSALQADLHCYRGIGRPVYVIGNTATVIELAPKAMAYEPADGSDPPYIAFAGRLSESKGVKDLIDAVALLKHRGCPISVRMAGDGDIARWTRYATELGVGDVVTFVGWIDGAQKHAFFRNARAFCMPSHFESFGISTLEAMFSGIPVIGSRLGGFLDLVDDGITGYLANPGDVKALAESIQALSASRDLSLRMGAAGLAKAHQLFSTSAIVGRYVACYQRTAIQPRAKR
jgi:glycosyltransferase involved in cell wall biosynthesis